MLQHKHQLQKVMNKEPRKAIIVVIVLLVMVALYIVNPYNILDKLI